MKVNKKFRAAILAILILGLLSVPVYAVYIVKDFALGNGGDSSTCHVDCSAVCKCDMLLCPPSARCA